MQIKCYMQIVGDAQGELQADSTISGREGKISVLDYNHAVGHPNSKQGLIGNSYTSHSLVQVTKLVGKESPLLMTAMLNKENLSTVGIEWYRPNKTGAETLYYRVELKNALISNIAHSTPGTDQEGQENALLSENCSFVYEEISWAWGEGGGTECRSKWRVS